MEAVVRIDADAHQRGVDRVEDHGLEGDGLGLAEGEGDDGHGVMGT